MTPKVKLDGRVMVVWTDKLPGSVSVHAVRNHVEIGRRVYTPWTDVTARDELIADMLDEMRDGPRATWYERRAKALGIGGR